MTPTLILASTSPYRQELLHRLGWPFEARRPDFDEDAAKSRAPREAFAHAAFLARGKAQSLLPWAKAQPASERPITMIGGDQLVAFENQILGKPGSVEKAVDQLWRMSGKTHHLHTAVCVAQGTRLIEWVHTTRLTMRKLSQAQIQEYVRRDQPLDCAGSYKIEKQGLLLFESIDCDDWTAIQGLPLMELSRALVKMGFTPFADSGTNPRKGESK